MTRNGGAADVEGPREFADCRVPRRQPPHNGAAGRIGESRKGLAQKVHETRLTQWLNDTQALLNAASLRCRPTTPAAASGRGGSCPHWCRDHDLDLTEVTSPRWSAAIGQIVEFDRSVPLILRPKGPYEVVSVLRGDEAISPTYRVKSNAEPFARGAREDQYRA
jgi:hypothetical protein